MIVPVICGAAESSCTLCCAPWQNHGPAGTFPGPLRWLGFFVCLREDWTKEDWANPLVSGGIPTLPFDHEKNGKDLVSAES